VPDKYAPPRFKPIALPDAFLAAGDLPTLHHHYGISADALIRQITLWLEAWLLAKPGRARFSSSFT